MRELSLFTGAGGGVLGSHLLGWTSAGYVENNDYCQRVIAARIKDGYISEAPIFGDIKAFIGDGYAASYTGLVDIVAGGFPCQPFSSAGTKRGANDERNLWPETAAVIRIVRPRFLLLENSPALLTYAYFGNILGDLAALGYSIQWDCIPASVLGAHHQRDRLWIVAHADDYGSKRGKQFKTSGKETDSATAFADTDGSRQPQSEGRVRNERGWPGHGVGFNWPLEPNVGRVVYGLANRMDRIAALGNGQVPRVVQAAWQTLADR